MVLGLLVLFVIIPAEADGDTWSGVSPLFFPTIIAAGFTLAAAGLLVRAVLRPDDYEGMGMPAKAQDLGFFVIACALILAGAFAIHGFGFVWGGPFLVAVLMLFMGERNWWRIVPMSVVPVAVIFFFVHKVLNAPLP